MDYPLILTAGNENGLSNTAVAMTTSSSPSSLSTGPVSPNTRYTPPPQLGEANDALKRLRENIDLLLSKAEGPTALELAGLVTEPCESIARDICAAKASYAASLRHAEQRAEHNAREQFRAEMMAFLHMSEQ